MDHGDFNVVDLLGAALIHFSKLLYAFLFEPATKLRNADHFRIMLFGDFDCVANVVAMTVSAEQDVDCFYVFFFLWTCRITHDPGIDDDDFAFWSLNAESGVSEPGEA